MEMDISYEEVEERQASELLSEVEQFSEVIRQDYRQHALETATPVDVRPAMERIKNMERQALDVYEQGLTDDAVPYNQRRQVADKVLEITGVIDKGKGGEGGGNTFVFGDNFAEKFVNAAKKLEQSFIRDVTGDDGD